MLCWADKPDVYLASPAVDLIRCVPTTWDETRVLPGSKIGEVAAFARRSGKSWYVAVLNGPQARHFKLDLSFLGRGRWHADAFRDAPGESTKLSVERGSQVNSTTTQTIHLAAGGGEVVRITK